MLERRDEIGELARSFNRMRFQIVEQFRQIKRSYEKLWETQQALSESEAHYRSLFENVPIGIYRSEPGGRILDANPALVKMFGYPDKESLLSRPARGIVRQSAGPRNFEGNGRRPLERQAVRISNAPPRRERHLGRRAGGRRAGRRRAVPCITRAP